MHKANECLYYGALNKICISDFYCINKDKTPNGKPYPSCKTCGIITLEANLSNLQYRSMEKKMEEIK